MRSRVRLAVSASPVAAAAAAVAVSCVLLVSTAHADGSPADDARARADAEFNEAKKLLEAGSTALACAKFARSQDLDPKLGRLLNLAYCHEQEGKTASAWREYNDAAVLAEQKGQRERVDFAHDRAAAVAKKLALVQLDVPEGTTHIQVDGVGLPRERWSSPLPLDPGDHALTVEVLGKKPVTKIVAVGTTAGISSLVLGPLENDPSAVPAPPPAPAPVAPPQAAAPAAAARAHDGPGATDVSRASAGSRVPAYVAAGLAAAGLGVGIAFGLSATSHTTDAEPHCPEKMCDPIGSASIADARSAATISTIGFGASIACAALATWLYLSPPGRGTSRARVSPVAGLGVAGAAVEGTW